MYLQRATNTTRKLQDAGYECIFLQGPHALPNNNNNTSSSRFCVQGNYFQIQHETANARAWFFYDATDPSNATDSQVQDRALHFVGVDDSLHIISQELQRQQQQQQQQQENPHEIQVVLGFSQGAVLGHMTAALASTPDTPFSNLLDAVILASGLPAQHVFAPSSPYCYNDPEVDATLSSGTTNHRHLCAIPSLHLIGRKDSFVDPQLSLALVDCFVGQVPPTVVWHDKGHVISQTQSVCDQILAFLASIAPTPSSNAP